MRNERYGTRFAFGWWTWNFRVCPAIACTSGSGHSKRQFWVREVLYSLPILSTKMFSRYLICLSFNFGAYRTPSSSRRLINSVTPLQNAYRRTFLTLRLPLPRAFLQCFFKNYNSHLATVHDENKCQVSAHTTKQKQDVIQNTHLNFNYLQTYNIEQGINT